MVLGARWGQIKQNTPVQDELTKYTLRHIRKTNAISPDNMLNTWEKRSLKALKRDITTLHMFEILRDYATAKKTIG